MSPQTRGSEELDSRGGDEPSNTTCFGVYQVQLPLPQEAVGESDKQTLSQYYPTRRLLPDDALGIASSLTVPGRWTRAEAARKCAKSGLRHAKGFNKKLPKQD